MDQARTLAAPETTGVKRRILFTEQPLRLVLRTLHVRCSEKFAYEAFPEFARAAPGSTAIEVQEPKQSKVLVHRFIGRWNKADMEALNRVIDQTVDENFVNHSAASLEESRCPEDVKRVFGAIRAAFPDGRTTIDDVVAEGDTVAWRWTFRGTHEGSEFAGVAPTGKRVTLAGINIERIAAGKFVERWYQMDRIGLMQLGVIARSKTA